ncbi:aspartokinase 2, chloroplastic-like isoform X2 [Camellia sinensis]|uniref:aspartokinase 2, chloroplastic-like isoform X2 n=1 Tax=Camellia sinensis TaxID=4442 RepID=UPI0010369675|nr:aspartokinase 2, chloroplastic-like isoform X2 [Camellia sinensis]
MSASLPTPFGVTTPAHNESFNSNLWCTATTRPPSISKFVEPVAVAVASSASCRFLRVCCKRVVKAGAIESPGSSGIEELTCVMKFGGSSVASAERMREVADLILSFPQERPVIVLSAMGKTTTNLLLAGEKAVSCGNSRVSKIDELRFIKELHLRTVEELGVDVSVISAHLEELEQLLKGIARIKELTLRTRDYLVSFGECLSTRVFDAYMNKIGAKARQYDAFDIGFITTDDFTNADILEATYPAVAKRLHSDWISDPAIPIVTGFLGKGSKSCAVTTLGRGGSDLTATTIGKALGLREIQVWKDVDGVLTCDPSIHPRAEPVPYLTFEEAAELAYFGAQVFSIFEDLGISVDVVATSEVSISLTLDPSKLWSRELIQQELDNVVEELEKIAVVNLLQHRSIISLIGNVQRSSLILEKVFNVLRTNEVNVQMISQGASKVNISLIVNDSEAERCVKALHYSFFESGDLSEIDLDGGFENDTVSALQAES